MLLPYVPEVTPVFVNPISIESVNVFPVTKIPLPEVFVVIVNVSDELPATIVVLLARTVANVTVGNVLAYVYALFALVNALLA